MRVRVYRNLHKNCYSVQHYIKGIGWRLHSHRKTVHLKNVTFKVNEAGRQRVLKEKRKNVHAFVEGDTTTRQGQWILSPVMYNPYKYKSFINYNTRKPRKHSDYVRLEFVKGKAEMWSA